MNQPWPKEQLRADTFPEAYRGYKSTSNAETAQEMGACRGVHVVEAEVTPQTQCSGVNDKF